MGAKKFRAQLAEQRAAREETTRTEHAKTLIKAALDADADAAPERARAALREEYAQRQAANPLDAASWLHSVPARERVIFGD
jgi:hypothetical protein